MIDDEVVTRLVELHDHIKAPATPPGAYVFHGERMLRRRRAAVAGSAVAAVAAAVMAVLVVTALTIGGPEAEDRIDPVRPGPTPSTVDDRALELIRAEGTMEREDVTESGISVRLYSKCDEDVRATDVPESVESVCAPGIDPPIRRAHSRFALEVAQDGRSALFEGDGDMPYVVTAYGDDSVIVLDGEPGIGVDPADPSYGRYRLLRADGTEMHLQLDVDPAPPVPGPDVVVIDRARYEGDGLTAIQFAFHFDESAGTLRRLDVPRNDLRMGGNSWGPNTREALWFVQAIDCRVDRVVGDTVEQYDPCGDDFQGHWYDSLVRVDAAWFPDGWLTADRMAVLQDTRGRLTLHASLDGGATWQHVPVSDEAAVRDALRQLG
jgi:hypothetical protein